MTNTLFVVVRASPVFEPVAVLDDADDAYQLATQLGPPHTVASALQIPTGQWRVVHTFSCHATVANATVTVGVPQLLAGASRVVSADDPDSSGHSVRIDAVATELERAVHGTDTIYLTAYASTADAARALAQLCADELASRP